MSVDNMGPYEAKPLLDISDFDAPGTKIKAGKPNTKENSEAFDSFETQKDVSTLEDFDEAFSTLRKTAGENMNLAMSMTEGMVDKMETLYKAANGNETLSAPVLKKLEDSVGEYIQNINKANDIYKTMIQKTEPISEKITDIENQIQTEKDLLKLSGEQTSPKIERLNNKLTRKREKKEKVYKEAQSVATDVYDKAIATEKTIRSFLSSKGVIEASPVIEQKAEKKELVDNKPPLVESPKPVTPERADPTFDMEEEESIPEDEQTNALIEKVSAERKLEESLSPGLLRLRKAGQAKLAELKSNPDLAKKLGVTTFDNTPSENTQRGGLKGIEDLQKTIGGISVDGILGTDTQTAIDNFVKKSEINPQWKKVKNGFVITDIASLPEKEAFPSQDSLFKFSKDGVDYIFFSNGRAKVLDTETKKYKMEKTEDVLALLGEDGPENNENLNNKQRVERAFNSLGIPHSDIESGKGSLGEYVGARAMLNNQPADSLWFYPETNEWRVMNPEGTELSKEMTLKEAAREIKNRVGQKKFNETWDKIVSNEMDLNEGFEDDWSNIKNLPLTDLKKAVSEYNKMGWSAQSFLKTDVAKSFPQGIRDLGYKDFEDVAKWINKNGEKLDASGKNTLLEYINYVAGTNGEYLT
jgi:hypothetical protein